MMSTKNGSLAQFGKLTNNNKVQCLLCPRQCCLSENQRGFCFVRKNVKGKLFLTTYGRSSGFAVDPIEKKPLYHFFPGSKVFSFGTAGCNLNCQFCQNWDISKSKKMDTLMSAASPEEIARDALNLNCKSVAFTYNDPVIFYEYAIDTADECHRIGIKTVAVTAAYINPAPREAFFSKMDAINVDLKSFSNDFYQRFTGAKLDIILDNLVFIRNQTSSWLELTTLIIPTMNDSDEELKALSDWVFHHLGKETPIHFSAFHPSYKMNQIPKTPLNTLIRAKEIAEKSGLSYVYTGNVHYDLGETTFCPNCSESLIERHWYEINKNNLDSTNKCLNCGYEIVGCFGDDHLSAALSGG